MRLRNLWILFAFVCAAAAQAQEIDLQAELLAPLGTETSRKGDAVSARITSPGALKGDIARGKITNLKPGNRIRGKSTLSFTFEELEHGAQTIPISSQVTSISNSKGEIDVDEEGHAIQKTNNLGKAAASTGAGAAIGAGAGTQASLVVIEIAAEGPSIRLAPGSKITLFIRSRSGPALASLSADP